MCKSISPKLKPICFARLRHPELYIDHPWQQTNICIMIVKYLTSPSTVIDRCIVECLKTYLKTLFQIKRTVPFPLFLAHPEAFNKNCPENMEELVDKYEKKRERTWDHEFLLYSLRGRREFYAGI